MTKQLPLVHIENLHHAYALQSETLHVLKGIDFSLYAGEFIALMGASGSGKSTFLHLLGCLDRPTQGKYFLNQQDVSLLNDQDLSFIRASQIGFIFQSFHLIPHFTVFENLEVPFLYQSFSVAEKEKNSRILSALEKVHLEQRLHHFPSQLSGGECQRVAIARALIMNPLLLLADEPTGNLDAETSRSILSLFQQLHREGATIILVTHDADVASQCQRTFYMQNGSIQKRCLPTLYNSSNDLKDRTM